MSLSPEQRRQAALSPLPPPSHLEAVAALRFYAGISGALKRLAASDATLGTEDCGTAINTVIGRLLTDGTASVSLLARFLGDVPRDPVAQRQWVLGYAEYAHAAAHAVMSHHLMVHGGGPAHNPAYYADHDHLEVLTEFFDKYAGMGNA